MSVTSVGRTERQEQLLHNCYTSYIQDYKEKLPNAKCTAFHSAKCKQKKEQWVPTITILKTEFRVKTKEGERVGWETQRGKQERKLPGERWTCSDHLQLYMNIISPGAQDSLKLLSSMIDHTGNLFIEHYPRPFHLYSEIHTKVFFQDRAIESFAAKSIKEDQSLLGAGKTLNWFI